MKDLNSLLDLPQGVILTEATDINNAGQVIAIGTIPEPESYAMLLAGLGLLGFMARRRMQNDGPSARGIINRRGASRREPCAQHMSGDGKPFITEPEPVPQIPRFKVC